MLLASKRLNDEAWFISNGNGKWLTSRKELRWKIESAGASESLIIILHGSKVESVLPTVGINDTLKKNYTERDSEIMQNIIWRTMSLLSLSLVRQFCSIASSIHSTEPSWVFITLIHVYYDTIMHAQNCDSLQSITITV